MTLTEIVKFRLTNQQIRATQHKTPKEIVGFMGAMQAQDYAMAKWALGIRLPNSKESDIQAAIDKGEIIRTHVLRPTWHFISAEDVHWMLELTAQNIKTISKSRNRELGLTPELFKKSNSIIEKALSGGDHLTRDELMVLLEKAKINTSEYRSGHFMLEAELDGIVCSGAMKNNKQTYALLNERVPKAISLSKEEALVKLAYKYFLSHGPATLKDFIWWSGLSVKDARNALELIKSDFISEIINGETNWFKPLSSNDQISSPSVYLLPAFDEFIISYKNREACLPIENQKKAFSSNGIFRPVILVNGQGVGIWKRTLKKDKVIIETDFFESPDKSILTLLDCETKRFGTFLGAQTYLRHI